MRILGAAIVSFLGAAISVSVSAQSLPNVNSEVVRGLERLMAVYNKLSLAEKATRVIVADGTPELLDGAPIDWTELAGQYKALANQIHNQVLITEFDESRFSVSLGEYQMCPTQGAAIRKLKDYLAELDSAVVKGRDFSENLKQGLQHIKATNKALRYIKEVFQDMISYPIYGSIFIGHWFDLETKVLPALGGLRSKVERHLKELDKEITNIGQRASNLRGNLSWVDTQDCRVAGRYSGNCDGDGFMFRFTTSNGTQKIVVQDVDNDTWDGRNIKIANRTDIDFRIDEEGDVYRFTGSFSNGYSRLSGAFRGDGDVIKCTLQR